MGDKATCRDCGKKYAKRRRWAVYCSERCGNRSRIRAYRERHKVQAQSPDGNGIVTPATGT